MSIQRRFNLIFLITFTLGAIAVGTVSYIFQEQHAHMEVITQARLMLEQAFAVRSYTAQHVRPAIQTQESDTFFPETVPSFAARQTFVLLHEQYPLYSYREAVLNPTNPQNRAMAWELEVVHAFRKDPDLQELVGEHRFEGEEVLYLAQPIRINSEACLVCHSTPDVAPPGMIETYGSANGFGWQLGEVIGAQIVSVPMSIAEEKVLRSLRTLLISLFSVSVLIYIIFGLLLRNAVIRPLTQLAAAADAVSLGKPLPDRIPTGEVGEVGKLATSVQRLQHSFERAMRMIGEREQGAPGGMTNSGRTEESRPPEKSEERL